MGERANFFDQSDSQPLTPSILPSCENSLIKSPLDSVLNRVHTATVGLGEIFRILEANAVKADICREEIATDNGIDPPLSGYSIGALLGLGAVVSEMLSGELERIERIASSFGTYGGADNGSPSKVRA